MVGKIAYNCCHLVVSVCQGALLARNLHVDLSLVELLGDFYAPLGDIPVLGILSAREDLVDIMISENGVRMTTDGRTMKFTHDWNICFA